MAVRQARPDAQAQLIAALLADPQQVQTWNVTPNNVGGVVAARSRLFRIVYPTLEPVCRGLGCSITTLWTLWIPLALEIQAQHQTLGRPLIQGILGGQGTGKTTLAAGLTVILEALGLQVCTLSIDDLYKTYADRLQLQQADPRFCWRGPPGTHEVELGPALLRQLRSAQYPVALPRFDKSLWNGAGDRVQPDSVSSADIVLFEGWFVGVRPVEPSRFDTAPPPILTAADRAFAREVNDRLRTYLPLWELLDRLIVLAPVDYRLSKQWRRQAEQRMIASGKAGMTDAEIDQFVEYFWRSLHPDLFIAPLLQDPQRVNWVIEIGGDRSNRLYRPSCIGPAVST